MLIVKQQLFKNFRHFTNFKQPGNEGKVTPLLLINLPALDFGFYYVIHSYYLQTRFWEGINICVWLYLISTCISIHYNIYTAKRITTSQHLHLHIHVFIFFSYNKLFGTLITEAALRSSCLPNQMLESTLVDMNR